MADVPLTGGSYRAKSLIAGAQRCCNLFAEKNEEGAPFPFTYYQRYGLKVLINAPGTAARGAYRATNGQLFEVLGTFVFYTDAAMVRHPIGTIAAGANPVVMSDNGRDGDTLVLVDGTAAGYTIKLSTHAFVAIADAAFYGATGVDYMDGVFVFNRPNSTQFYLSPFHWNGADPFDPLDIADKIGGADDLVRAMCNAGNVQLVGVLSTEIWYDAAGADFQFARVPSVFIEHGTPAAYSVCQNDVGTYFLSQDKDGGCIFLKIVGYEAKRFSTHSIEAEISKYAVVADCIGQTYQYEGHTFVKFSFPTADKCWVFDEATNLWHEETWTDSDGQEHMHRGVFTAYAYGLNLAQDWENGQLYSQDVNTYQDNDVSGPQPIVFRRGFPHLIRGNKRFVYSKFVANMEVGSADGLLTSQEPLVSLRWSDTKGKSWVDPVTTGMGATGQYDRQPTWWQLGTGQDRTYEMFWSAPYKSALMGAYIDGVAALT